MSRVPIPLDRVHIDRLVVAPRSSTLHLGPGPRPGLETRPWWVYLAGPRLPASVVPGPRHVAFRAATPTGRELSGDAEIIERMDDAYGTRLVIAGIGPLPQAAAA